MSDSQKNSDNKKKVDEAVAKTVDLIGKATDKGIGLAKEGVGFAKGLLSKFMAKKENTEEKKEEDKK